MWTYYPELLETPVPRYTSYPTAADFGPIETRTLVDAIEGAAGEISLYLHIPFCEKICFYCGCNTGAAGRRHRLATYLAALKTELAIVAALLPGDACLRRVAFGGGSPNALAPEQFLDLVEAIHWHFRLKDPVWSIELDPRSMTAEWGEVIGRAGITRASMGVQTFARHCQLAIGREQSDALICRSIDWLRAAGVNSLNFDLMYGLPQQTMDDLADTLEYTRLLGADRIALFGYAHVPQVVPRQRMIDAATLPPSKERFRMAEFGHGYLTDEGYEAIGFDHFALPADPMAKAAREGTLRRNFQGFTDDMADRLVGLGSSAVSCFPELIAQNEKNSGRYRMQMSQGHLSASRGIIRSREDMLRGSVIEALLCQGRAQLTPCLLGDVRQRLEPFIERGLASVADLRLSLAADAVPYARGIAALFDPYRVATQRRFSSAI